MPNSAPAMPIRKFPIRNAVIFQRTMSRPKQLAAVSSSRIASRLSPIQERSSRRTRMNEPTSSRSATTK